MHTQPRDSNVSNGSFNVHTFRDDEHLCRDANHQSICLIDFLFLKKREKCLELHYRTKPKKKMIRLERTVIVDASHQLISLCAGSSTSSSFLFLLSSAMSSHTHTKKKPGLLLDMSRRIKK